MRQNWGVGIYGKKNYSGFKNHSIFSGDIILAGKEQKIVNIDTELVEATPAQHSVQEFKNGSTSVDRNRNCQPINKSILKSGSSQSKGYSAPPGGNLPSGKKASLASGSSSSGNPALKNKVAFNVDEEDYASDFEAFTFSNNAPPASAIRQTSPTLFATFDEFCGDEDFDESIKSHTFTTPDGQLVEVRTRPWPQLSASWRHTEISPR